MGTKTRLVKREVDVEEVYAQCAKCNAEVISRGDPSPYPKFGRDAVGWVYVSVRDLDLRDAGSGGFVLCADCVHDVRTAVAEIPKPKRKASGIEDWMARCGVRIAGSNVTLALCDDCGGARQLEHARASMSNPFIFTVGAVKRSLEANDGRFVCSACSGSDLSAGRD